MNQIIDHIFISDIKSAQTEELLDQNDIDVIINCTTQNSLVYPSTKKERIVYNIPINDPPTPNDTEYLNNNFINIVMFMEEYVKSKKNILVHCVAGSQRSSTIVTIYIMCKFGFEINSICKFLQSKRPICFFCNQINYISSLKFIEMELKKYN